MELAFATGQVDPPDRLAAWRELVNRVFLPLAITPIGGTRAFEASVSASALGAMRVWRVSGTPMSAVRARRHIEASGHDEYLLALHIAGTAHGAQDGREVTLGPGDGPRRQPGIAQARDGVVPQAAGQAPTERIALIGVSGHGA